jgi:chromosome segregation ATPase
VSAALELERETLRGQLRRVREEFCALEMQRATENDRSKEAAAAAAYAHESEIETLRKEHKSVVARMQDVNESAARTANEALATSNAETAKWRAMYDKRESRPEDLRRIKELQNDLQETTARLERSVAHRRTLQSELMGRAAEFDAPSARGAGVARARAAYAIGR